MRMRRSPELRPNGWDALLAGAVAALAVLCAALIWSGGGSGGALTAVVSADGAETDRVALAELAEPEERTYVSNGYTLHVTFGKDAVEVTSSDCPTQDCVHTGAISRSGQSIVCLPARLVIQLEGGGDGGGPDVVIG